MLNESDLLAIERRWAAIRKYGSECWFDARAFDDIPDLIATVRAQQAVANAARDYVHLVDNHAVLRLRIQVWETLRTAVAALDREVKNASDH